MYPEMADDVKTCLDFKWVIGGNDDDGDKIRSRESHFPKGRKREFVCDGEL